MKYKIIAESSLSNGDRICIYMKFDPLSTPVLVFAGQQAVNGQATSIKNVAFTEVLAWAGFNDLTDSLYRDPSFTRRYKVDKQVIYPNRLIVSTINDIPHFFYKLSDTWSVTDDLSEIEKLFDTNPIDDIEKILGSHFVSKYKAIVKERSTCEAIKQDYEKQKQEVATLIKEQKSKTGNTADAA